MEQHQLGNAVTSQESLTSQNSQVASYLSLVHNSFHASLYMQASGNITYAELEHHIKGRRTQHRDTTGVLYSEIKVCS